MTIENFITELEGFLTDVEPGSIKPETKLADIPAWDSLAVLNTISVAEETMGAEVSGQEIKECQTVQDLYDLVQSHQGN